ncbi:hypothetical protein Dacet_0787 [Denitrovibrio acetiphilus DSM 12809]|uniref:Cytochrome c-552/4 domain-containing protein n=1 Tax=Denitrovibrio acetiphilus (strain DSM 12809 / NBRC 114555 / N2460) TaxID=522772 RepID=D4H5E7_DENA2|nr:hypothetical protein [Denitrovibrio acetiphilus]ADD67567.1 hypothetical protein Dacet_0787 [Denitrovibrio acetiphilus DSM 12809]
MSRKPTILKKIYCILGIALMVYCGYIVEILVMHIWHKAPHSEHSDVVMTEDDRLFKEMLEGVEKDHKGVARKDMNETHKLYEFHKSERKAVLDTQSLCVACHGDVPHDKKKEIRAFLNMHTFFMACETCHIKTGEGVETKFVWYDKQSGEQKDTIGLNVYLGDTPYKLLPLKKGVEDGRIYDTDPMIKYVAEFRANVTNMLPSAKSASLKVIHRPMSELKDVVRCDDCHTKDRATAYLPYKEIGYPDRRVDQLIGNEVVGMIEKYKKFYLPDFLIPKEETESEN